jgi:hypothetical protein
MINIITDSEQLRPLIHNCSANYPITINLKPNHEFSVPVIFVRNRIIEFNRSVRFGFVVADPKQFPDMFDARDQLIKLRESREDIIWSEVIEVSIVSSHPFILKNVVNDSTYTVERIY